MKTCTKRIIYILLFAILSLALIGCDNNTRIEKTETSTPITNPNTFYYNSYSVMDMSNGEMLSRHSESGSISINGDLIVINRGSGTLTYIVRERIYNDIDQTYIFKTNKLDVLFDPTMKILTISDECIQFNINSTIKSNW